MRALTDFLIDRYRIVLIVVVALLAGGLYAYRITPASLTPDIRVPMVFVQTMWPGASVTSVEKEITLPIERELEKLKNLKTLSSFSGAGWSFVMVEFEAGKDTDVALRDVRDGVDEARDDLPPDALAPSVSELAFDEVPILILSLSGTNPSSLRESAERIQERLESIDGVAGAEIFGAPQRDLLIEPDPLLLRAKGLTLSTLSDLISGVGQDLPIGEVSPGGTETQITFRGRPETIEEIENLYLLGPGGGFRVGEIATVRVGARHTASISRQDGLPAVSLVITKGTGHNTILVTETVLGIVDEERASLPLGQSLALIGEQATTIKARLGGMLKNLGWGFLLVTIILFAFIGFRSALLISLGIPLSVGFALILMNAGSLTFNNVTLFGLILVLGMIVDDDIIVVENIYRHIENGLSPIKAARKGIHEVSVPILTAIGTTILAFFPLTRLSGIMGEFIKYIPFMVIFCLLGALIVGHFIAPPLARIWLKRRSRKHTEQASHWRDRHAALLRRWGMRPGWVLGGALTALGLSLFAISFLKFEFFPSVPDASFRIKIEAPVGTALERTNEIAYRVEEVLERHPEWIRFVTTNVGTSGASVSPNDVGGGGPFYARISGEFHESLWLESPRIQRELEEELASVPGARIQFEPINMGPPVGRDIVMQISGTEFSDLILVSEEVEHLMRGFPFLQNVDRSHASSNPEKRVVVDSHLAANHAVSSGGAAREMRGVFEGLVPFEITLEGESDEIDVVVRYPRNYATEIGDLSLVGFPSLGGGIVPFAAIAHLESHSSPQVLTRRNGTPNISVSADLRQGIEKEGKIVDLNGARAMLLDDLSRLNLPPGTSLSLEGENTERENSQSELSVAFLVALVMIFLLLVGVFNSFRQALVILSSVPFALIGVVIGLTIMEMAFGFLAMMAVVALTGIVVNDSIVLVDRVNALRKEGLPLLEAVAIGSSQRLRPIMMTSVTTIAAFIPMTLDQSQQGLMWAPLGVSIMFGLAFATGLILLVVPCIYILAERKKEAWRVSHE